MYHHYPYPLLIEIKFHSNTYRKTTGNPRLLPTSLPKNHMKNIHNPIKKEEEGDIIRDQSSIILSGKFATFHHSKHSVISFMAPQNRSRTSQGPCRCGASIGGSFRRSLLNACRVSTIVMMHPHSIPAKNPKKVISQATQSPCVTRQGKVELTSSRSFQCHQDLSSDAPS